MCRAGWVKLATGSQSTESRDEKLSSGRDEQQQTNDADDEREQVSLATVVSTATLNLTHSLTLLQHPRSLSLLLLLVGGVA